MDGVFALQKRDSFAVQISQIVADYEIRNSKSVGILGKPKRAAVLSFTDLS